MLRDKQIVLKYTRAAMALELLCVLLIMAVLYVVASMYPDVPELVPTEFDVQGIAVAWGVRETALLGPILAVFLYLTTTGIGVIMRKLAPRNEPKGSLAAVVTALLWAKLLYLVYAIISAYRTMLCERLPVWLFASLLTGLIVTAVLGVRAAIVRYRQGQAAAEDS